MRQPLDACLGRRRPVLSADLDISLLNVFVSRSAGCGFVFADPSQCNPMLQTAGRSTATRCQARLRSCFSYDVVIACRFTSPCSRATWLASIDFEGATARHGMSSFGDQRPAPIAPCGSAAFSARCETPSPVPLSAAKHTSLSNRRRHSQSIEPSRQMGAALCRSPTSACPQSFCSSVICGTLGPCARLVYRNGRWFPWHAECDADAF
jgi:hypothetical protein